MTGVVEIQEISYQQIHGMELLDLTQQVRTGDELDPKPLDFPYQECVSPCAHSFSHRFAHLLLSSFSLQ